MTTSESNATSADGVDGGARGGGGRDAGGRRHDGLRGGGLLQVLQERLPMRRQLHQLQRHLPRGRWLRVQRRSALIRPAVALALLVAVGCGDAANMGAADDAGTGGAGGMAGAQASTGGQAGTGPAGTGGATAAGGTIGSDFTRADHDMCVAWPVCPDDIFSVSVGTGTIAYNQCSASDGGKIRCASCLRRSTCEPFVGRCIARFLLTAATGIYVSNIKAPECRSFVASDPPVLPQAGWALCTGDTAVLTSQDLGVNANTVCKD